MIQKILRLKVTLPIVTILFLTFFAAPTIAKENNLYLYEEEIIQEITQRKEEIKNPYEDIKNYKPTEKSPGITVAYSYTKGLLNREIKQTPTNQLESPFKLIGNNIKTSSRFYNPQGYIYEISQQKEKNKTLQDIKDTILSFKLEAPEEKDLNTETLLTKHYIDLILEEKEIKTYVNFIELNTDIVSKKIIEEEIPEEIVKETVYVQSSDRNVKTSGSKNVTLSITIVPVRFVYVNEKGQITQIWNNVEKQDSIYGLKFYRENSNVEIEPTNRLKNEYFKIIKNLDIFAQGIIYDSNQLGGQSDYANKLYIEVKNTDYGIEEIYTII